MPPPDCICPSSYPAPSGAISSCSPKSSDLDSGGNIKMFLGEIDTGSSLEIFSTQYEDFIITDFSAKELFDAEILNSSGDWDGTLYKFDLTERELLASGSWESWIAFMFFRLSCNDETTFAAKVLKNLGIDLNSIKTKTIIGLNEFMDVTKQDNFSNFVTYMVSFVNQQMIDLTEQQEANGNQIYRKAVVSYEWFRKIYDEYYGKKFLVRIGENGFTIPFHGVCVKNKDGSNPPNTKPFYITGNGSAQGLYSSDMVSTEGGWPARNTSLLLGLDAYGNNIKKFKTDDGKIDCFTRFGTISDGGNPILYNKFDIDYVIDFSKLSPDSYVIENEDLYLKCSISDRIYFDNDGQWVLVTLSNMVPLRPKLDTFDRSALANLINIAMRLNSSLRDLVEKAAAGIFSLDLPDHYTLGASSSLALLNQFNGSDVSFFPKGFIIPLASNIFSYGPYYYDANTSDGGGVEYEKNDSIKPWNFIHPNDSTINDTYDNMDCVGQALARDGAKGLQKLEKGSITVVGLPEYNIGHSVSGNDGDPTVITDISIEYGTGGIKTTYNFSTYSPRFGRPSKYILDAWQDSINRTQNINNILKQQQLSNINLNNTLTQKITQGGIELNPYGWYGPKSRTRNSPSKLLISGYYRNTDSSTPYNINSSGTVNDIGTAQSPLQDCVACLEEPPDSTAYPTPTLSAGNQYRLYTFAETHESYQQDYIQHSYNQLCIFSLDGFFLPVSLKGEGGTSLQRLPRFAKRLEESGSFVEWKDSSDVTTFASANGKHPLTKTRDEMPPFMSDEDRAYALPIHQLYLNPILSSGILVNEWGDSRKNNSTKGFVISTITFGDSFEDYQLTFTDPEEDIRQAETNFRFSALRGPLVLQGWGYDTSGKPIPNAADAPKQAEAGEFRRDKLTDKFMENWLENPRTWPVGPVDLRFDRERGVWSCPSPNKILVARLLGPLSTFGSAEAKLINPTADGINFYEDHHISGPNGEDIRANIERTRIRVYDFLGIEKPLCTCDIVYVYWDSNRYIVLESARTYKNIPECEVCTTTPTPCPSPCPCPCPSPSPCPCPSPSPSFSIPPSQGPSPSVGCWVGLDVLKTIKNYNECKTQALIHRDGCLEWEDIVECDPIANQIAQQAQQECEGN